MKSINIKLKIFAIIVFTIGFVLNGVIITLYNVGRSENIGSVNKNIRDLRSVNNNLIQQISENDSLTKNLVDSGSLGYVEKVKIIYLDQTETVAKAP